MDAEIEQACPLGPQSKMGVADDETETPKLNIRTASESRTAEAILMFIPFSNPVKRASTINAIEMPGNGWTRKEKHQPIQ